MAQSGRMHCHQVMDSIAPKRYQSMMAVSVSFVILPEFGVGEGAPEERFTFKAIKVMDEL